MTERYRYAFTIECPACKTKGAAYASEDDQPLGGVTGFSVDSLPPGFILTRTGASFADTMIFCAGCGRRARENGGAARAAALQN